MIIWVLLIFKRLKMFLPVVIRIRVFCSPTIQSSSFEWNIWHLNFTVLTTNVFASTSHGVIDKADSLLELSLARQIVFICAELYSHDPGQGPEVSSGLAPRLEAEAPVPEAGVIVDMLQGQHSAQSAAVHCCPQVFCLDRGNSLVILTISVGTSLFLEHNTHIFPV